MKRLAFLAVMTPGLVLAQQPQISTPAEQALGNRLIAEINSGIQCSTQVIALQRQIAADQAKIKELEAKIPKPEPPKDTPK